MKPTVLLLLAVACSAVAVTAPEALPQRWGGDFREWWWDKDGSPIGYHRLFSGGLSAKVTREVIASWSPWKEIGPPHPDFEVGRGTVSRWNGNELSGFHWYQTADGFTWKDDFIPQFQDSEPPSPRCFWGHYYDANESAFYISEGWINFDIDNTTRNTLDMTLDVAWFWTERSDHTTREQFSVKPGEIGGCFPEPKRVLFGWVEDYMLEEKERP